MDDQANANANPKPQAQDAKEASNASSPDGDKQHKILLAEDEEDARMIYKDILEVGGFHVDTAENGKVTLDKLAGNYYDLLLLDIIMPDIDGISVLTEIKKFPAKYNINKIVMLTNIGGDLAIEKALNIGANGYMLKSETAPENLVDVINKYLHGEKGAID
jgi:CheY-like chemotaxis protein